MTLDVNQLEYIHQNKHKLQVIVTVTVSYIYSYIIDHGSLTIDH